MMTVARSAVATRLQRGGGEGQDAGGGYGGGTEATERRAGGDVAADYDNVGQSLVEVGHQKVPP